MLDANIVLVVRYTPPRDQITTEDLETAILPAQVRSQGARETLETHSMQLIRLVQNR